MKYFSDGDGATSSSRTGRILEEWPTAVSSSRTTCGEALVAEEKTRTTSGAAASASRMACV